LVQSLRLILERRPVKLTPEEEHVRRLVFPDLPPRKVLEVLSIGHWTSAECGEQLIKHGKSVESVSLLLRGKVRMTKSESFIGELVSDNFVGSALLLSGMPAEVDGTVVEPVKAITWDIGTLKKYLAAHPETRLAMQHHLAVDLADKLKHEITDVNRLAG